MTFDRCRIMSHNSVKILQGCADFIFKFNCFTNLLLRDRYLEFFFEIFFEAENLSLPKVEYFSFLGLWQFHDEDLFEFAHVFVHFLLTVTCRLSYNNV